MTKETRNPNDEKTESPSGLRISSFGFLSDLVIGISDFNLVCHPLIRTAFPSSPPIPSHVSRQSASLLPRGSVPRGVDRVAGRRRGRESRSVHRRGATRVG